MIWFKKDLSITDLNNFDGEHMGKYLGLEWVEVGNNYLKLKMPVDNRTKQPYGLLHGGASCVLAETIGSVASALIIDPEKQKAVGLEINANHVKAVRNGFVVATCSPFHIGKSTHVWDIKIHHEATLQLVCVSRLTVAII